MVGEDEVGCLIGAVKEAVMRHKEEEVEEEAEEVMQFLAVEAAAVAMAGQRTVGMQCGKRNVNVPLNAHKVCKVENR